MTRDDIIRLARQAGFQGLLPEEHIAGTGCIYDSGDDEITPLLERFAALVAAAEREAIAQMIEDAPPLVEFSQNDKGGCMVCGFTPKLASAAIRSRSES